MEMSVSLLVFIRSMVSFLVLFIFTRFIGKQQLSQLTVFEYLVGITIGSIASAMSIELEIQSINGVVGIIVWGIIPVGLAILTLKSPIARKYIEGEPRVVIRSGRIVDQNIKKERMDLDQLMLLLRQKNIFSITDVEFAILEVNGQLSVMPRADKRPITAADLKIQVKKEELPFTVIKDGKVNHERLLEAGLDSVWLEGSLRKQGVHDSSEVMLAQINGNQLHIDMKKEWEENVNPGDEKILTNLYQLQADFHQYHLLSDDPMAKRDYLHMKEKMDEILRRLETHIANRRN